jgi:hypothetical protein
MNVLSGEHYIFPYVFSSRMRFLFFLNLKDAASYAILKDSNQKETESTTKKDDGKC